MRPVSVAASGPAETDEYRSTEVTQVQIGGFQSQASSSGLAAPPALQETDLQKFEQKLQSEPVRLKDPPKNPPPAGGPTASMPRRVVRVNSGLSSIDVMKMIQEGRVFWYYKVKQGKIQKKKIALFYVPDPKKKHPGFLYWCKDPNARKQESKRCIPITTITDVLAGKQSDLFKTKELSYMSSTMVFSIHSRKHQLELEALDRRDALAFLSGIKFVFESQAGKPIFLKAPQGSETLINLLDQDDLPAPTSPARAASPPPRAASPPARAASPAPNNNLLPVAAKSPMNKSMKVVQVGGLAPRTSPAVVSQGANALKAMAEGREFFKYEVDPSNRNTLLKKRVMFFYHTPTAASGIFYWCEPGKRVREPQNALPFRSMTDVYLAKQSTVFSSLTDVSPECCLTLCSTNMVVDLEADNAETATTLMNCISHVVNSLGKQMVVEEHEPEQPTENGSPRTVSRMRDVSRTAGELVNGENKRVSIADKEKHAEKEKKKGDVSASIRSITTGRTFVAYGVDDEGNVGKQDLFVYYRPEPANSPGTLYWAQGGAGAEGLSGSIPLKKLRSVFVGKQTAVLQSELVADVPADRCFTLVGKHVTLDLEAENKEQVQVWLTAIKHCLSAAGTQTVTESQSNTARSEAKAEGEVGGVRANPEPRTPRTPPAASARRAPDVEDPEKLLSMMTEGTVATIYDEVYPKKEMFLYYNPKNNAVCWCDVGERIEWPSSRIAVEKQVQVQNGKQSAALKAFEAKGAVEARCFSLQGAKKMLSVELPSEEARAAWVDGLHYIRSQQN